MADENKITVPEPVQENTEPEIVSIEDAQSGGLTDQEIKMGQEQGTIAKEDKKEEKKEGKDEKEEEGKKDEIKEEEGKDEEKEDKEDKEKSDKEIEDEDPEREHERIKDFNPNEKALYFKQKKERKKRQEAQRKYELTVIKSSAKDRQIAALDARLKAVEGKDEEVKSDTEYLTKEDLDKREKKQKEKVDTERQEAQAINDKLNAQEETAKDQYDEEHGKGHFDAVMNLAKEIMESDKTGIYALRMTQEAMKPDGNTAEVVYKIGMMHPEFKKTLEKKEDKKEEGKEGGDKNKVKKVIDNAKKRTGSAQLGGGAGSARVVGEDDLTLEDASRLTQEQYNGLSEKTRHRLLKE